MYKKILTSATVALLGFASLSGAQASEGLSKAEIEKIVMEYVKSNPQVLIESLENYRVEQEQEKKMGAQEKLKVHKAYLEDKKAPFVGNVDADVIITEFFDYNCGYCRRAMPDIQALVKEDSNVRFVFREMPILSENSNEIAKWSLAAHKQGKYFELHVALMEFRGNRNAKTIKKMAADLGLDAEQLEKDANSRSVAKELAKDLSVARDIGIQGTPAFVINGEMFPGYLGPEGLKRAVESARQKL